MRLAFVLFNWFPHGGLQQDLVKVIDACRAAADISIFCMAWEGPQLPGVNTTVVPVSGLSAIARRRSFANYIIGNVSKAYDKVVGFNRMPGLDYYFAADTCFAEKASSRGWWYALAPRTRQYLDFERAVFGAESRTCALLLSPQQREQYKRHYRTPDKRLIDIPPGIGRRHQADANALQLRAEARSQLGIADHELLVLQVGSGFRTKGVVRSMRALASLPDTLKARVRYLLIGRDKPAQWCKLAARLGLEQRVQIVPPRDDIPRVMQAADILLHPSVHESAGMVLLEAVVAGLPVLTTASCGYAFHVQQAQAGIVSAEPFSQQDLNRNLLQMLQTERSTWRTNGIHYGQTHNLYDMPQTVAEIVLSERSPAAAIQTGDHERVH